MRRRLTEGACSLVSVAGAGGAGRRRRLRAPRTQHRSFKYLNRRGRLQRSERPQGGESADDAGVAAAVREGTAQLERYLADERLARQFPGVRFVGLIVVFHGWELVFCDAVQR